MTPLGLVDTGPRSAQPLAQTDTESRLEFEEALASEGRVWLRGRLIPPLVPAKAADQQPWWGWWRRKRDRNGAPPVIRLETRISGQVFQADVPLRSDGRFEATLTGHLPVARRGWRIARNRVTGPNGTAEKCSVVVVPPENARDVVVVLLPLAYTLAYRGAQQLARSELATRLTPILRRLHQRPGGTCALYYLAMVPASSDSHQAELALATTTLGWPSGNFVLLPADSAATLDTFITGIDRLRWLFAGALDLLVLNMEPSLTQALRVQVQPREDRARIQRLVSPDEDPWTIFNGTSPAPSPAGTWSLRPTRAGLVPRHPVVFCHGMLAFSTLSMHLPKDLNCFSALRPFLRERGFRVLFPQVAPTSGVAARAQQLRDQITRWTNEPVNLVAHSMGGLDARYLVTHLGMADRVRSLTTVATPHRGTYLVDWFLANYRQRVPLLLALETLGVNIDGFRDCRPAACCDFNAQTPDMPQVRYFSYGGAVSQVHVTPVLRRAWSLLTAMEGPNDGMVSTASARWGEYLGTLHADHFAQTPDKTFVHPKEDFDALGFYVRLLEDLARKGF